MSEGNGGLDERINIRGEIESIRATLTEREKRIADQFEALDRLLNERFVSLEKKLNTEAIELARRLHDLNGEYKRDRERQADYVRIEKFEDKLKTDAERLKAESVAREAALLRVDEKFDDYVKRYEQDKRETDLALAAQKGAAEQAKRAAEEQGRKSNRNLAIATLLLGIIAVGSRLFGVG